MIIQAENISKRFGSTVALDNVSINLEVGEVHALVGENGAGKSTLFKILAGYVPRDSGKILYKQKEIEPVRLLEANTTKIALVHQELNISQSIGIPENIFFGSLRSFSNFFGYIDYVKMEKEAQKILDRIGANINVKTPIKQLDLGQMKIIQVAQALAKNPEVLFLDESTAYLNIKEVKSLLGVVNNLKQSGIAIGFVSHHLNEIDEIADCMTILKDGKKVGCYGIGEIASSKIESLMVGREQHFSFQAHQTPEDSTDILEINDLIIPRKVNSVSLRLKKGEILGLGGLKGAGGEAVLKAISGLEKPTSGTMKLYGENYKPNSPALAKKHGISYLPGSRLEEGLIDDFSISDNIVLPKIPNNYGCLDGTKILEVTQYLKKLVNIKTDNLDNACCSLSGGNMQKVVFAKCLETSPKILLLNNPTRGIDVGARNEIYKLIEKLAEEDFSFILLSEDLVELIGLSDRILVFNKGIIKKEFSETKNLSEKQVVSQMI